MGDLYWWQWVIDTTSFLTPGQYPFPGEDASRISVEKQQYFLCLAALYESWTIPISIMLALPLGVVGGVIASSLRGFPNDVYFQIGLLTVLGLTTKNAILIVQFAKLRVDEGLGLLQATLEGAKLRLRPIVMTSLAFGFGVLPLAVATGAGAQTAIGTSVLGGMLTATFLAIFFIPLFYVAVVQVFTAKRK
ncbi:MAG: efflux RND transporter permease subunit [Desulfohalobiaceae bacterium]|nr:efflux RND transporter permease subunit [Desulfohalobiaceae bacterium]